jgi:hypothetical protein
MHARWGAQRAPSGSEWVEARDGRHADPAAAVTQVRVEAAAGAVCAEQPSPRRPAIGGGSAVEFLTTIDNPKIDFDTMIPVTAR